MNSYLSRLEVAARIHPGRGAAVEIPIKLVPVVGAEILDKSLHPQVCDLSIQRVQRVQPALSKPTIP